MKTIRTKAIVLRRTNYGEADRIVQLLTPEHGKVSAIARGVRRERSKLAGGIELFCRVDSTLAVGKGELLILTGTRIEQVYRQILTEYDRLQFAYDVLKYIARAAQTIDEPAFFELCDEALAALDDVAIDVRIVRAWFWLQLAILLGVGLNLETDSNGMKLVGDARYNFDMSEAVFTYHETGRFGSDHIKLLRLLSAQSPKIAQQVNGIGDLIDDCLWVAEQAQAHE